MSHLIATPHNQAFFEEFFDPLSILLLYLMLLFKVFLNGTHAGNKVVLFFIEIVRRCIVNWVYQGRSHLLLNFKVVFIFGYNMSYSHCRPGSHGSHHETIQLLIFFLVVN